MKRLTQSFAIIFFVVLCFSSCNISRFPPIYGNHNIISKEIVINDYDEVSLNLPANVIYQQFSDSTPYLQINTDENIFSSLDIRVEGRTLLISAKPDSIIKPSKLTIYTSSKNIRDVSVNGSGELYLRGEVNAKVFDLDITGSGELRTDSLFCDKIGVKITGSGNANLKGAANRSVYSITGSGDIHAFGYSIRYAACNITGSGNIEVWVNETLDVSATGSGNISYKGAPKVNGSVVGSGKIIFSGEDLLNSQPQ
jgi:hypothetical protein